MYLTGNEKPDFRTICNFKKECKELIENTFKKTVKIKEIEEASGKKMKNAAKNIIEQHALGDERQKEG